MPGSTSEFSDWANLPLLVLYLISEKIDFITDYVRYRVVCSSWRFASLPRPRHLPPQLPWLFYPKHPKWMIGGHTEDKYGIRYFFDFWKSKDHKIHVPETIDYTCLASCRGWLLFVACGGKEVFLLNPLTRDRVHLPPCIGDHGENSCIFCNMFDSLFNYPSSKLSFSTNPTDPNCLIMVFIPYCRQIYFCQVRDHCWTKVNLSPMVSTYLDDVAYYSNGRFYLLLDRSISIYDSNQHKVLGTYFFKTKFRRGNKFFFEGKSGLYVVAIHSTEERGDQEAREGTENALRQKIELYQVQKQRVADDSFDGACVYLKNMEDVQFDVQFVCAASARNYCILSAKLDDGKSELVAIAYGEKWGPFWISSPPTRWFQPSFV